MRGVRKFLFLIFFCVCSSAIAQQQTVSPEIHLPPAENISVTSGFLTDSVRIGDEVVFFLTARYPTHRNVLFPDTAFNYSPFEFKKKKYFPTRSSQGISYDSVLYHLTTYEIDTVQSLTLPVYELIAGDCTAYVSARQQVYLRQIVSELPDTLTSNIPVRATVAYQDVPYQFNVVLVAIFTGILLSGAGIVWFFFGTKIQRHYYVKRLRKDHEQFINIYSRKIEDLQKHFSSDGTESALSVWKTYMEQLNRKPYRKLTAREIGRAEKDEALGKNLRSVDAAIYGHSTRVVEPLNNLMLFAKQRFKSRIEQLHNGQEEVN